MPNKIGHFHILAHFSLKNGLKFANFRKLTGMSQFSPWYLTIIHVDGDLSFKKFECHFFI